MSRSKPTILTEKINAANQRDQILASTGIWAVYFRGQPINFRNVVNYQIPKYRKTAFANPGHAINLARKLNAQFKTTEFTVMFLSAVHQVYP
jgi:hypothetical protein